MSVHETLQVPAETGNTLAQRYEAVTAAAAVVAGIAAIETGPDPLVEALADSHGRTAERAHGIVADMAAVLEPGIATLLADTLLQSTRYWLGDLCFVLACVFWAIFTVLLRVWNIPAWNATVGVVMVAGGLYLPIYFAVLPPGLGQQSWALILGQGFYQGVLATIVQMVFYVRAVQLLGATRMGALMALVPALAAGLAVPLFGETLTPVLLLSIGLVMLGALLGNLPPRWLPVWFHRASRSSA